MKISRCLSVLVLAALAAFDPAFAGADKPAAEDGEAKPAAEAEEAKPKSVRKPKKKDEYSNFIEAKRVAEAWECPIVVLVTLQGSKPSAKINNSYFMKPDLKKELFLPNAVFCRISVPQKQQKGARRQNGDKKDPPVIPDLESLRADAQQAVREVSCPDGRMRAVKESDFPLLAVLSHQGRLLQNCTPSSDGSTPLKELVKMVEGAMKSGKYEVVVSPKMQKIIDKDTAVREKAAKRAK